MTTPTFARLGVPEDLIVELDLAGITTPTPIQAATLPDSLAGRDVLGRGRTGSGKTLAFLLPLVARLAQLDTPATPYRPRAVILAPTRELAIQIDTALAPFAEATGLSTCTIFGGVNQNRQVKALKYGVDVVVACPGRLEDLMRQDYARLDKVDITILDEADHMADLGFLPGVKRILAATPRDGQRLLFSATLDGAINQLVKQFLQNPVTHEADSAQSPVSTMTHHILHIRQGDHFSVLKELAAAPGRCVVFTRTKYRAKKLARQLNFQGIPAVELHGNLSQNARTRTMDAFHSGEAPTLVATDIAARGIHVDDVGLVIHADPPVEHKAYLHRSGRTARAGTDGNVVTLMTDEQRKDVSALTRKAGIKATTTTVDCKHPVLQEIAPGEREFPGGFVVDGPCSSGSSGGRGGGGRGAGGRGAGKRGGPGRGAGHGGGRGAGGGPSRGGRGAGGGRRDDEGSFSRGRRDEGGFSGGRGRSGGGQRRQDEGGYSRGRQDEGGYSRGRQDEGGYSRGRRDEGGYSRGRRDEGGFSGGRGRSGGGQRRQDEGGYSRGRRDEGGYSRGRQDEGGYSRGRRDDSGFSGGRGRSGGGQRRQDEGGYSRGRRDEGGYSRGQGRSGGGGGQGRFGAKGRGGQGGSRGFAGSGGGQSRRRPTR